MITRHIVTQSDFVELDATRLVKDVLILPVSAFGSGQAHSGSKDWGNE